MQHIPRTSECTIYTFRVNGGLTNERAPRKLQNVHMSNTPVSPEGGRETPWDRFKDSDTDAEMASLTQIHQSKAKGWTCSLCIITTFYPLTTCIICPYIIVSQRQIANLYKLRTCHQPVDLPQCYSYRLKLKQKVFVDYYFSRQKLSEN